MKKGIIIFGVTFSLILMSIGTYGLIKSGDLTFLNNNEVNNKENNNKENITLSIDDLQSALLKLKNANSFSCDYKTTSSVESYNINASLKLDLVTNEDEILYAVKNVVAMHSYAILEEENLVSYSLVPLLGMNEWIKSTGEVYSNYDNSDLDIFLENISLFKIENNVFKAILPKELAIAVYSGYDLTSEDNDSDEILGDIPIEIHLSSDKNISIINMDYSNNIKIDDEVITEFKSIQSYSNIGNTKITVPEEVKNSAKTIEFSE